jgi:mannose-6-phosphate isomerase-like protein (cupin superfamily)
MPGFDDRPVTPNPPKETSMTAVKTPVVHTIDDAQPIAVMGGSITVRVRSADTDGQLGVVENLVPAGFPGPPLHVHPGFDEVFHILEGDLTFTVEDRELAGGPGTVLYVPGAVPHTFAQRSCSGPARFVLCVTPGGFEEYFEQLAAAAQAAPGGVPAAPELARLMAAYGVEIAGAA